MSIPSAAMTTDTSGAEERRRVQIAKKVVLVLACVVGLTLVVAAVFAVCGWATDRPVKELFKAH